MAKTRSLKVPKGLSPGASRIWRRLTSTFRFEGEETSQLLLLTALQAHDRMHEAREIIAKEGLTIVNRYSVRVPNPLLVIEDKSRKAMILALKELGLQPSQLGNI
jgi:P27 family predicted phage terminase small subunit